ncbi:hypothetical protein NDU88_000006 [Pleurodeles waltl]|uniref:Uncharacterized protein n=1 Tax=Pleurodeles waltl TaxID=8319 RepID=A0AAV7WIC4_PLEWA|nr:hypothetical protein NDU88_000006 [Pleurodeles waltl]
MINKRHRFAHVLYSPPCDWQLYMRLTSDSPSLSAGSNPPEDYEVAVIQSSDYGSKPKPKPVPVTEQTNNFIKLLSRVDSGVVRTDSRLRVQAQALSEPTPV